MGKQADKFILCEPFAIAQEGFDPARSKVVESLFSQANEYMGVRGYPEEGTGAPSLLGSYLGGVYEWGDEPEGSSYRGVVRRTHYMVCAADFLKVRLWVGDSQVVPDMGKEYTCRLDFRTGALKRAYLFPLPGGGEVKVCLERILGMDRYRCVAQRITLVSDREIALRASVGVDGTVRQEMTGKCLWQERESAAKDKSAGISFETATSGQSAAYLFEVNGPAAVTAVKRPGEISLEMQDTLKAGIPYVLERDGIVLVGETSCRLQMLEKAGSFSVLEEENRRHYDRFWQDCDVEIEGSAEDQQGIRFCLFQLHQTYRGLDKTHNIGAKGLTGEAYNGHAFWDSETYCLPYYLLTDPSAARGLLQFRYNTLGEARKRAKDLDCQGACYPIATMNGAEACTLWQHASLQMQPSTAVAYAILLYTEMTGDRTFLLREGIEMLTEICRYVVSRGNWNHDHTQFGFWGVMGPDEFHMMVNNDFYTNYMGKKTLEGSLGVLADMEDPDRWASPAERETWAECARAMRFSRREDGVYEQQDGFFTLPHLDISSIPIEEFPLYDHWSYDRIYRTDMIKQPDVLMAMFLHPEDFTREELEANYAYYEPRCIHESSLSPSVHAVLAQQLGRYQEAFDFFGFASRLDLDNYNRNTDAGLHTTSIAAAWISIVFGFGGLKMDHGLLSLEPHLPGAWKRCSFRLRSGESVICVNIGQGGTELSLVEGPAVFIRLNGEDVSVA